LIVAGRASLPLHFGTAVDPDQVSLRQRRLAGHSAKPVHRISNGDFMSDVATYVAQEQLRDGSSLNVLALQPEDEPDMLAALAQASVQSLQRRFFVMKRHFSDKERAFFMDVDFKNHVALIARAEEGSRQVLVGGCRYIVSEPARAEMAFMVVDGWQGRGVGSILMRHLINLGTEAGLKELTAEVLPENTAMRKIFTRFGFKAAPRKDPQIVSLMLKLS
jgi:RimJ/RimL family protein N-acetyltransferase